MKTISQITKESPFIGQAHTRFVAVEFAKQIVKYMLRWVLIILIAISLFFIWLLYSITEKAKKDVAAAKHEQIRSVEDFPNHSELK